MFVDTVDMKIKACNAFNAMSVDTVDTGVCFLCSLSSIVQHQYRMSSIDNNPVMSRNVGWLLYLLYRHSSGIRNVLLKRERKIRQKAFVLTV